MTDSEPNVEYEAQDPAAVEDALYQAALSGNIPAITHWLAARSPERWGGRTPLAVASPAELARLLGFEDDQPGLLPPSPSTVPRIGGHPLTRGPA